MANLTSHENQIAFQELLCSTAIGPRQKILISSLSGPLAITAIFGNVLIISALQKVTTLYSSSKVLLGCLACTDLGVGIIIHPLRIGYTMSPVHSEWCFYLIRFYLTIGSVFCAISLFTLTAISIDRLLAISLGLRYRHVVTWRKVWILVVIFWVSNAFFATLAFYSIRIYAGIVVILLGSCIVISTFCYLKIYVSLSKHQKQVQEHIHQGQPNERGVPLNITRYKRTVSSALWVQVTLLVCYLPFGIVTVAYYITESLTPTLKIIIDVAVSLMLSNSSLNPFLYCWKIREVKQAVKETIRQFCCFSSQ